MTELVTPPQQPPDAPVPPPEEPSGGVPLAPPLPAWVAAAAEAEAFHATLDETAHRLWRQWTEAVAAEVLTPYRQAVQQAATAHQRLLTQAAFGEEMPVDERWRRVTTYRRHVGERVLHPLRTHLGRRPLGEGLATGCLALCAALEAPVESVASHRTLPRPILLYAPSADDRLVRRLRKAFVRGQRGAQRLNVRLLNGLRRVFRLEALPLPALGRLVPLRDVGAYHVHMRLAGRLVPLHEAMQHHVATLVGRLETLLTDWAHAVLNAERELDRLAFHQPALLQALRAPDGAEAPAPAEETASVEAFIQAATVLQQGLEALQDAVVLPDLPVLDVLQEATRELEEDLRYAGTFLLNLNKRRLPSPEARPVARLQAGRVIWKAWHHQACDRLVLNEHLLKLRQALLHAEDTLLRRIAEAALQPVLQTFQPISSRLRQAEQDVADACDAALASQDLETLKTTLLDLQTQTMQAVQAALSDLPGLVSADQALAEPGRAEWAELLRLVEQLPETLYLHPLLREDKPLMPERRPWRMEVRPSVQDVLQPFEVLLAESAQPLRKQIVRTWSETEQIAHIVQYNLDAALDALADERLAEEDASAADDETPANPLGDARELATDGLRRAADTLMDLARSLQTPWQSFAVAVFSMFEKDWSDVHRSVRTEAFVEEQWFDFWMRAHRQGQRLRRWLKERSAQYAEVALRLLRLGRRRARLLIERGRSAIGTAEATEEDRLRTIDAIAAANVRALHAGLPLVYRKLFSFAPVREPSLFEGRHDDLQRIRRHVQRWQAGRSAGALVLPMPLGSGRTSLLNVVRLMLQAEVEVRTLTFDKRLDDASDFAEIIAAALGIEMIGEPSLDALETQLLGMPRAEPPLLCLIDNLEHLLLRTFGGTDLVERVLIFFSRTDTQVCWISVIGDYTWRFLEQTLGTATGLVTTFRPVPLVAATLEGLIINRHRRSGMVLRFAEPKDLSPLVRRRLNRAKSPEARQALLREIYFDRLHRASGQNVMLALFYWLHSADFEAEEGLLTIRPIEPLSFRFFDTFDLARAFTLKALMVHNTLTLAEHNQIFRMTDAESTYLLESLLNLNLIEPCSPEGRRDVVGNSCRILPDERYRLHPLILHPTYQLLRSRNIIH